MAKSKPKKKEPASVKLNKSDIVDALCKNPYVESLAETDISFLVDSKSVSIFWGEYKYLQDDYIERDMDLESYVSFLVKLAKDNLL